MFTALSFAFTYKANLYNIKLGQFYIEQLLQLLPLYLQDILLAG